MQHVPIEKVVEKEASLGNPLKNFGFLAGKESGTLSSLKGLKDLKRYIYIYMTIYIYIHIYIWDLHSLIPH